MEGLNPFLEGESNDLLGVTGSHWKSREQQVQAGLQTSQVPHPLWVSVSPSVKGEGLGRGGHEVSICQTSIYAAAHTGELAISSLPHSQFMS